MHSIPRHVAIIPDGNRRWAEEHGLPVFEGHRRGAEVAKKIIKKAWKLDIKVLTLWAFSTENWNRSEDEVKYLTSLFERLIDENLKEAIKDKVRLVHIGRKDRISSKLHKKIMNAEEKTKEFDNHYLVFALDYGGQDEVLRAISKIQEHDAKDITNKDMYQFLDTKDLPHPDVEVASRESGLSQLHYLLLV